jgi:hypothetical protein
MVVVMTDNIKKRMITTIFKERAALCFTTLETLYDDFWALVDNLRANAE